MTKIQIWIFLRILVGFKKFFLPKESICLRCYKKNVFFFILTYSLLGRGPKCLQKFLLKKCQKWPKVFLRRIFQKKRKTFFFVPNRKRTHSCNYLADHFFYILFFLSCIWLQSSVMSEISTKNSQILPLLFKGNSKVINLNYIFWMSVLLRDHA